MANIGKVTSEKTELFTVSLKADSVYVNTEFMEEKVPHDWTSLHWTGDALTLPGLHQANGQQDKSCKIFRNDKKKVLNDKP